MSDRLCLPCDLARKHRPRRAGPCLPKVDHLARWRRADPSWSSRGQGRVLAPSFHRQRAWSRFSAWPAADHGLAAAGRLPDRPNRPMSNDQDRRLAGRKFALADKAAGGRHIWTPAPGRPLLQSEPTLDQACWRRRLHDDILTDPTGMFWAAHHQHAELSRHDVEAFGDIFADPVQRVARSTGSSGAGLDYDQDRGNCTGSEPRFCATCQTSFRARPMSVLSWPIAAASARHPRARATTGPQAAFRRDAQNDDAAIP